MLDNKHVARMSIQLCINKLHVSIFPCTPENIKPFVNLMLGVKTEIVLNSRERITPCLAQAEMFSCPLTQSTNSMSLCLV